MDITERIEEMQNLQSSIDIIEGSLRDILLNSQPVTVNDTTFFSGPNNNPTDGIIGVERFTDTQRLFTGIAVPNIDLMDGHDEVFQYESTTRGARASGMLISEPISGSLTIEPGSLSGFVAEPSLTYATALRPMQGYVQLTQEDYDSLLDRISSLENRIGRWS